MRFHDTKQYYLKIALTFALVFSTGPILNFFFSIQMFTGVRIGLLLAILFMISYKPQMQGPLVASRTSNYFTIFFQIFVALQIIYTFFIWPLV